MIATLAMVLLGGNETKTANLIIQSVIQSVGSIIEPVSSAGQLVDSVIETAGWLV